MFIKSLNTPDTQNTTDETNGITRSRQLDTELKEILVSFKSYVNAIDLINLGETTNGGGLTKKDVERNMTDLENRLTLMIGEYRIGSVEKVVNLALDVARNANEIFLNITKSINAS